MFGIFSWKKKYQTIDEAGFLAFFYFFREV